jgi:membrane associated rhomboid family serine protease
MTTPETITEYREALVLHLRLQEVPADRIGEIVAEVESHVADTGEDPADAFGSPRDYARSLTDEHRKPPWWWTTTTLVLAAAAGWLIAQGAFALLLGEPYWGRSGWLWVVVGVAVGIPPAIMVGRRSREVLDPRTGEPLVRTPRWAPLVFFAIPVLLVLIGWVAIELAN